jgi:hypothetical protein
MKLMSILPLPECPCRGYSLAETFSAELTVAAQAVNVRHRFFQ